MQVEGRAAGGLEHRQHDVGLRVARAVGVGRAGRQAQGPLVGGDVGEAQGAGVGGADRADLDLHAARVRLAVAALQGRARQAPGDALDVAQQREHRVRVGGHVELVLEDHEALSRRAHAVACTASTMVW